MKEAKATSYMSLPEMSNLGDVLSCETKTIRWNLTIRVSEFTRNMDHTHLGF